MRPTVTHCHSSKHLPLLRMISSTSAPLTISNFKSVSEKPFWPLNMLLLKDLFIFLRSSCIVTGGDCICACEVFKTQGPAFRRGQYRPRRLQRHRHPPRPGGTARRFSRCVLEALVRNGPPTRLATRCHSTFKGLLKVTVYPFICSGLRKASGMHTKIPV